MRGTSYTLPDLREILCNAHLDLTHETKTQDGIEAALREAGIRFEREVRLGPGERIDFLVHGGIGVEVKLRAGRSLVLRQLHRYAAHDRINALILVTSTPRLTNLPATFNGKPVVGLIMTGSLL